jgi:hypothetical protein
MIRPAIRYCREEVWPRKRRIVLTSGFVIAALMGVTCGLYGEEVLPNKTKVLDVGMALLTYAAIAQGFCLAGLTLLLTLPNDKLLSLLANHRDEPDAPDAYSDLLFVFSWTAVIHWMLLLVSVVLLVIAGSQQDVWPTTPSLRYRIVGGFVCGFSLYNLFQFLITLITISQVGRLSIVLRQNESSTAQAATSEKSASIPSS